jgi:hypothetical protein
MIIRIVVGKFFLEVPQMMHINQSLTAPFIGRWTSPIKMCVPENHASRRWCMRLLIVFLQSECYQLRNVTRSLCRLGRIIIVVIYCLIVQLVPCVGLVSDQASMTFCFVSVKECCISIKSLLPKKKKKKTDLYSIP